MKKHIFIFLSAAVMLLASCEKSGFLNRLPYTTTTRDTYYINAESNFNMALTGCYECINANYVGNGVSVTYGTFWQGLQWILQCPSDEIVTNNTAVPYNIAAANMYESDATYVGLWNAYYNGIYRCNELLYYLPIYTGANKLQYEAEARFLRAFYYNHMALVFGAVPIVGYPSTGQEPRSPLKDVYEQILKDYQFAYDNLGETGMMHPLSANKYTAAAYIVRVCNYLAACKRYGTGADLIAQQPLNDFSFVDADSLSRRALNAAKDIIENSSYGLVDEYHMLFRETTKDEQYKECLFCADLPLSGSEGSWPAAARMAAPAGSTHCPQVYGNVLIPNPLHFYLYDKRDVRRDHNFHCNNTVSKEEDGTVVTEMIGGYPYPMSIYKRSTSSTYKLLYDSDTQTYNAGVNNRYSAGKYRLVKKGVLQHGEAYHCLSYPLMRLADVYLMAGEAEYFVNGDPEKARDYFRPVTLRAVKNDTTLCNELMTAYQKADFIDEILEHRQRELIFEFSRKSDLIRFNRMDAAIAAMSTETIVTPQIQALYPTKKFTPYYVISRSIQTLKDNWEPYKIWGPLSVSQIVVNQNLTQNAGW